MAECALDALAHASNDAIHLVRNIPMPGVGESRAGRHTLCWVAIVSEWRGASSSKMAAFFPSKEHRNNIFCLIWFLVFYFGLMNKFLRFWTVVDFLLLFYGSGSYGGFHSQCPASAAKMGFPRSTPPPPPNISTFVQACCIFALTVLETTYFVAEFDWLTLFQQMALALLAAPGRLT